MREREREREREERDSLGAEEAATAASRRRLLHLLPVLDRRDAEAPTKTPLPPVHTGPPPRRNLRHAASGRLASKFSAPEGAATAASHRRQLLLAPVDDVVPRETRDRRDFKIPSRARSPRTQNCPDRRKSNAALLRKMPTELPAPRNCRLRHRQLVKPQSAGNFRKTWVARLRHPLPPPATRNLQFLQRATPSTTYLTIWHRPPGARHTSSLPTAPLSAPHQRSSDTQRHRKFIQTIT